MGLGDKFLGMMESLFTWMWQVFIEPFLGLKTLKDLIFGKDTLFGEELVWKTFTENELLYAYIPGNYLMMIVAGFMLLIAVLMAGMRISGATINPANRTALIDFLKDALIVGIALSQLGVIYSVIFQLNGAIVGLFEGATDNMSTEVFSEEFTLNPAAEAAGAIIGWIVIQLALLGLAIWANFYYMMRKLTLMLLMILGPVMLVLYLFPKTKAITSGWFKELIGGVLVQSIHAATFWLIAVLSMSQSEGAAFSVGTVILYIIFIPVSEALRNLFGLGGGMQGGLAKTGAMFGMAGLAGMYGAVKGALDGKSVGQVLKEAYKGTKDKVGGTDGTDSDVKGTLGANTGTDTGTTSKAEKMLKAGNILGKSGKLLAGMGGSIAGSVMGPVGAVALGTIGGELGEKVGGVTGRAGAAGVHAVGDRLRKGKKGFDDSLEKNQEKDNEEAMIDALTQDESVKWANDNKEDFMKDMKERFPDARPEDLEAKWNEKLKGEGANFRDRAQEKWNKVKESNGQYADAGDMSEQMTKDMTSAWADENRENFMKDYQKNNPPAKPFEEMSEDEKLSYENQKISAWNDKLNQKEGQFRKAGEETAAALVKGNDHNLVNKQDFANAMVDKAIGIEKNELKKQTDLGTETSQQEYELLKGERKQALVKIAASSLNSVPTVKNPENAKAGELGEAISNDLTKAWAEKNKEAFQKQYDAQHMKSEPMSQEETTAYQKQREKAWNSTVSDKKSEFDKLANQTINEVADGNTQSVVGKGEFTSKMVDNLLSNEKASFIANNADRLGGVDKAESAFNATVGDRKQALTKVASTSASNLPNQAEGQSIVEGAKGSTLANAVSMDMTKAWESQNKDQFMKNYETVNPPSQEMSPAETKVYQAQKDQAWRNVVQGKQQQFSQAATEVVSTLSNGNPNAVIDKSQFANAMVDKAMNIEKAGVSDISSGSIAFDIDYAKGETERKKVYASAATNSANGVEGIQIFNKGGSVNKNFLASQLASVETASVGRAFIKSAEKNGASYEEATAQWKQQESGVFNQNYQRVMDNIPPYISSNKNIVPSVVKAGVSFAGHATGISTVLNTAKGIGQGALSGYSAFQMNANLESQGSAPIRFFEGIGSAIKGGYNGGLSQLVEGSSVVEKQQNLRNGVSYISGVIGGVGGYTIGSKVATKLTPFSKQLNQEIYEPAEVMQMAQTTVDDMGNTRVANGAIRMVTSSEGTHIEVRTKTGESKIVSRMGSGHSGLKKGETIFQDLDVQNDSLVPVKVNGKSSVYKVDSGGAKIPLNSVELKSDPNRLLATRQPASVSTKQMPVYSQQVDMGNFHTDDALDYGMKNIQVVVERGQSYVSGEKDGQSYRLSPIYSGDTRVPEGKKYHVKCEVKNLKLTSTNRVVEYNENDEVDVDYHSSLDLTTMLPKKVNKRLQDRNRNEPFRRKQGLLG